MWMVGDAVKTLLVVVVNPLWSFELLVVDASFWLGILLWFLDFGPTSPTGSGSLIGAFGGGAS